MCLWPDALLWEVICLLLTPHLQEDYDHRHSIYIRFNAGENL